MRDKASPDYEDHDIRGDQLVFTDIHGEETALFFQEQRLKEDSWYDQSCPFKATNMVMGRVVLPNLHFRVDESAEDDLERRVEGPAAASDCQERP